MIVTTNAALALDPSTVPVRDCRAFSVQPFARCYVTFEYAEGSCPIYEEFVFNDQGEMTFIEACRAWKAVHGSLPCKLTFFMEGEEESGSPSLVPFMEANTKELQADLALICDTGLFDSRVPAITTMLPST